MSVDVVGDPAILGTNHGMTDGYHSEEGAAYTFTRTETGWAQESAELSPVKAWNYYFGNAVAVAGTDVLVGARGDTNGAVYLIRR